MAGQSEACFDILASLCVCLEQAAFHAGNLEIGYLLCQGRCLRSSCGPEVGHHLSGFSSGSGSDSQRRSDALADPPAASRTQGQEDDSQTEAGGAPKQRPSRRRRFRRDDLVSVSGS